MSDWSDSISSSARRVLTAARDAAAADDREPFAIDLLRAMLDDEGHATELLRNCGLQTPGEIPDNLPALSLPRLIRDAGRLARSGEETSSLHLLAALVQSDEPAARQLESLGLPVSELLSQFANPQLATPEPIAVEVRIAPALPAADDLSAVWRILDAAANRAREGLRVLEDYARFGLNDPHLTKQLKGLRHRLAQREQLLLGVQAVRFRDTPRDVGTAIHTRFEACRETDPDIIRANSKRVQEALRTLEEYGKRVDPHTAGQIGQLRYDGYTLERALLTTHTARQRLGEVQLCLLATDALCPRGVGPVVRAALAGGCPMVQLREKDVPDGQLIDRARFLREWTREAGALFIVNDRPDIAVLADADGVHLGQEDLPCDAARRIVGGDRLIGVSTHNVEQIRQAVLDGADYLGVGPVFPSSTKAFDALAGLNFVRAAAAETALPWFAIGGITADNLPRAIDAGARRIAVTAAVSQADDPTTAARALLQRLQSVASG